MNQLKILHITESFGGGVTSAINSYASNAQQHDHYIFASTREQDITGEEGTGPAKEVMLVPRKLSSISLLKKYIHELSPDVTHIHSTYAGFFCRLLPFLDPQKIIYTPHGFSFLRNDHALAIKAYEIAEKALAKRTAMIAACGLHEKLMAEPLIGRENTVELINVCDDLPDVEKIECQTDKPVIGMVGRITDQKGFSYFRELAESCRNVVYFKWIGGGDSQASAGLREAGIEVTGWLSRHQVIAHMKGLDLYFHSAAWDGFPISVLEAAKLNLPIMLRKIGPFDAEGLETLPSIESAIKEVIAYSAGQPGVLERARSNTLKIQERHTTKNLQNSLSTLYARFA